MRAKNRMREIRSSGSVRGGDGNIPAYSAGREPDVGAELLEAGIAVDLHHAFELCQMGGGTLGLAIGTVEIDRGRLVRSRDDRHAHRPKADRSWCGRGWESSTGIGVSSRVRGAAKQVCEKSALTGFRASNP